MVPARTAAAGGLTTGVSGATASFDVVAGRQQRLLVGISSDDGKILAGGSARFRVHPASGKAKPFTADATFLPIAGQRQPKYPKARFVAPSEVIGVFAAPRVVFPSAGFWLVTVDADTDRGKIRVEQPVEVLAKSRIPAPGDPAPRTRNLVIGTRDVTNVQLDSRAVDSDELTDPTLHKVVIADAIAAHRPVVVVVSTPVFCTSQFCGPVTDSVQALAKKHPAVDFVHLEVWKDFEKHVVNKAAADWILPHGEGDGNEPWVFLIGRDGRIAERFDNVVSDADLARAVTALERTK